MKKKTVLFFAAAWGMISAFWNLHRVEETEAEFRKLRSCDRDEPYCAAYILPGIRDVPDELLCGITSRMHGDVWLLDTKGSKYDVEKLAVKLFRHIDSNDYQDIKFFAFSQSAQLVVGEPMPYGKVRIYAIDPVMSESELRPETARELKIEQPLARAARAALGPVADMPLVPAKKKTHSLNELASLRAALLSSKKFDRFGENCRVIVSNFDEITDPDIVKLECCGTVMRSIDTGHEELEDPAYLEALEELGAFL